MSEVETVRRQFFAELNRVEATRLYGLVGMHTESRVPARTIGYLCTCGRVWLSRLPGSEETGCRQVRLLRKALRAAERGSQGGDTP